MRTQKLVNGNVYMDYTYIGDKLISQTDHVGNATLGFIYDAFGDMIGVKYDGETYFYMRNLQGDVCGIYDSDGDLIANYLYDAWGKLLNITDANGVHISDLTNIAQVNPIRYRGYYYDSEFEFYYLQSRYYWPDLGRFISADVYFQTGDELVGTNMYAYCLNNPIMYFDPTGYYENAFSEGFAKGLRAIGFLGWLYVIAGWSAEAVTKLGELPLDEFLEAADAIYFDFYKDVFLGGEDPWSAAGYVYVPGLGEVTPEEAERYEATKTALIAAGLFALGAFVPAAFGEVLQLISILYPFIKAFSN